ncbi:hypothetical protein BHM03_00039197, partial [Ensete ventricosum]
SRALAFGNPKPFRSGHGHPPGPRVPPPILRSPLPRDRVPYSPQPSPVGRIPSLPHRVSPLPTRLSTPPPQQQLGPRRRPSGLPPLRASRARSPTSSPAPAHIAIEDLDGPGGLELPDPVGLCKRWIGYCLRLSDF